MKGFLMTRRSRYRGLCCPHCYRMVQVGQSFLGHTLYVQATRGDVWVRSQSGPGDQIIVRFVYHRDCLGEILARCPESNHDIGVSFEAYRAQLARQYETEGGGDESLSS